MNKVQRFLIWILPEKWGERVRAESNAWKVTCDCGKVSSVWELGGIRFKAAGNPNWRVRCTGCKKVKSLKLKYDSGAEDTDQN